jgi:CheY-like chemotaxis protein
MVRAITTRILKQAGYTVVVASDGAEAVALFREHASDIAIVLLDAIMPKMTGHEAYDQIRLLNPDIPVLFCSGYDPDTSQVSMLIIEGAPMVQKPFDPSVLLQTIRNVIDKRKTMEPHLCPA